MDQFWTLRFADLINIAILLATIWAIVYGPIKAVKIAGDVEAIRDAKRRRREIFSTLMRTRRTNVMPDHVGALNLIQVEFFDYPSVLAAHKAYMGQLALAAPTGAALDPFIRQRDDLFFDLLHELSKAVEMTMDKREIDRLGYVPQGWHNDDGEVRTFRRAVIEILEGRKPLPVTQFQAPPSNPFPPPPP